MMNKLGIKLGKILLVDERDGRIAMEKNDIEEFTGGLRRREKRLQKIFYLKYSESDDIFNYCMSLFRKLEVSLLYSSLQPIF